MKGWWSDSAAITCRSVRPDDAALLARLHKDGFERAWSAAEFEPMLSDASVAGLLATRRLGKAAGFVLARIAADEAEILSIVVAADARRQGIGGALLGGLVSTLAQRRVKALFLEVEEFNAAAIALYDRYDFKTVGKRTSYYKRADGSTPAAIVMRRDLTG